ncbi:hypothetical protein ACW5F0_12550 [Luteimonas sp. A534]
MTISIEDLRYVRMGSADPVASAAAAMDLLGMQEAWRANDVVALRSDHRDYTLLFERGSVARPSIGLEVRDEATLERAATLLLAQGVADIRDPELAARRQVRALLGFTTPGGLGVELVVRPLHKGWRFHPGHDSGLVGLAAVAIRTPEIARDEALWTGVFGMRIADWIGDAAYLGFDRAHHRLSLHPSDAAGLVSVEFGLQSCDKVMQLSYRAREQGLPLRHGPGRRCTSDQVFLSVEGADGTLYTAVAEGSEPGDDARPRQFSPVPSSYCAWGSACDIPEYCAQGVGRPRPQLREVGKP